jgi:hypothetical protein
MSTLQIEDGPSKWGMILGLFETAPVSFTVRKNGFTVEVTGNLTMVETESGGGESWNFHIYLSAASATTTKWPRQLRGYYSTAKRKGTLEVMP